MTRRKFSREFKTEAVRLVTERGVAVAQAARDLDVAESVLRRWMRELTPAPVAAFPGKIHLRNSGAHPNKNAVCRRNPLFHAVGKNNVEVGQFFFCG